jgi:hypothetical protein
MIYGAPAKMILFRIWVGWRFTTGADDPRLLVSAAVTPVTADAVWKVAALPPVVTPVVAPVAARLPCVVRFEAELTVMVPL